MANAGFFDLVAFWWGWKSAPPAPVILRPSRLWAAPEPGRIWRGSPMPNYLPTAYPKYPGMTRTYGLDFGNYEEVIAGETLSNPTISVSPGGLTAGSPGVVGVSSIVAVTLSGGTAGITYDILATVTTSGGAILQQYGQIEVPFPPTS